MANLRKALGVKEGLFTYSDSARGSDNDGGGHVELFKDLGVERL
jgi:hypothetical protein